MTVASSTVLLGLCALGYGYALSPHTPIHTHEVTTDFETFEAGVFEEIDSNAGRWSVVEGKAFIDDTHAASGKKCLHLPGGHQSVIVWTLPESLVTPCELRFRCERWTARSPFSFRIDIETSAGWEEVYNGDDVIRVGRPFLSEVKILLEKEGVTRIRFTVTSPPNTGILIDDLQLSPAIPQRVISVDANALTYPTLVGGEPTPAIALEIQTEGILEPISLKSLRVSLDGFASRNLQSLTFSLNADAKPFTCSLPLDDDGITPDVKDCFVLLPQEDFELSAGLNRLLISCTPHRFATSLETLHLKCSAIEFSDNQSSEINHAPAELRLGVALRSRNEDGVDTYRIPGLVTTTRGSLVAVYDIRYRGGADLPADIDIGMSRSIDKGITWEPMRVILDMGSNPEWNYDGVGDPAILVDRETGTIWVAGLWSHGNRGWHGSAQGLLPEETGQLLLVRSDDDGVTWSKPINITSQVKNPNWCLLLQGPGKGITMSDGTLVFAAQFQDTPANERLPYATILYSKDHGVTWQIGTGAFPDTTEAQVVEMEPGVLMLNCRYNRANSRIVMVTHDLGKTWKEHSTSQNALIEPRACMASLIRRDESSYTTDNTWLFFSNPNSLVARERMTIKASNDLGMTWPEANQILLDQGTSAGYSCLTMIDDSTLGILYEGSQAQLTFQRIPIRALTENK